jgi:uncharacterized membrane protein
MDKINSTRLNLKMIYKIQSINVSNFKPKITIHNLWHSLKEMPFSKEHNQKVKILENITFRVRLTSIHVGLSR